MTPNEERITLAAVCDDHYTVLLAALIKSIELHQKIVIPIDFYVVNDGISQSNREKLSQFFHGRINIHWIETAVLLPDDLELPADRSLFPKNIYYRLFLADYMPVNVERFVYLDVDMIFKADIFGLWNTAMNGRTIAAVTDRTATFGNKWAGIKNYDQLKIGHSTPYFNSGLLMIDIKNWKEENASLKVIKCINENIEYADYPDQYGLNVVFAGRWHELDRRWNCQSRSECVEPYVVHFTGRKPIYKSYFRSPDFNAEHRQEFYNILRLTPWKGFTPINEFQRILQKLRIQIKKNRKLINFRLLKGA